MCNCHAMVETSLKPLADKLLLVQELVVCSLLLQSCPLDALTSLLIPAPFRGVKCSAKPAAPLDSLGCWIQLFSKQPGGEAAKGGCVQESSALSQTSFQQAQPCKVARF